MRKPTPLPGHRSVPLPAPGAWGTVPPAPGGTVPAMSLTSSLTSSTLSPALGRLAARLAMVIALVLPLAGTGCERAAADSERERAIATEQEAIQAYSEKIAEVNEAQERFASEWKKANEIKNLEQFRAAIEEQVIRELQAYVTALKIMPTNSPSLTKIHNTVVKAYEGGVTAFKVFIEGLEDENVEARYQVLLEAMDGVAAAEKGYRSEIERYYADNRVKLVAASAQ